MQTATETTTTTIIGVCAHRSGGRIDKTNFPNRPTPDFPRRVGTIYEGPLAQGWRGGNRFPPPSQSGYNYYSVFCFRVREDDRALGSTSCWARGELVAVIDPVTVPCGPEYRSDGPAQPNVEALLRSRGLI